MYQLSLQLSILELIRTDSKRKFYENRYVNWNTRLGKGYGIQSAYSGMQKAGFEMRIFIKVQSRIWVLWARRTPFDQKGLAITPRKTKEGQRRSFTTKFLMSVEVEVWWPRSCSCLEYKCGLIYLLWAEQYLCMFRILDTNTHELLLQEICRVCATL